MTNVERQNNNTSDRSGSYDERRLAEARVKEKFIQRYLSRGRPTAAYLFRSMKAIEARLNSARPEGDKLDLGGRSAFYKSIANIPDFLKAIERDGASPTSRRVRGLIASSSTAAIGPTRF